ncbi:uncharacterized protein LOC134799023 [Cydia splendana]|uniref:uncharacterized protein LOC134799023 n=1 Tax=Cydia splendana TaxID=1100963 RepID=UPI0028F4664D
MTCIVQCLYEQTGILDANGRYVDSILLEWLKISVFSGNITQDQATKIATACNRVNHNISTKGCERAIEVAKCIHTETNRVHSPREPDSLIYLITIDCRKSHPECLMWCIFDKMEILQRGSWYSDLKMLEWMKYAIDIGMLTQNQAKNVTVSCKRVNEKKLEPSQLTPDISCAKGEELKKCLLAEIDKILHMNKPEDKEQDTQVWSREHPWTNRSCYVNLGPRCHLGPAASVIPGHLLRKLIDKTEKCDQCSSKNRKVGLVCTRDKDNVYQEMDRCVMQKMNCLGGLAGVQSTGKTYEFTEIPFAIKPRWGRISVRGDEDAHIRFYDTWPYNPIHSYWVVLNGFWGRLKCRLWENEHPPPKEIDNPFGLRGRDVWTEYTVVWNKTSGWFLMSQPREPRWREHFLLDHVSSNIPWNIKYFDVSGSRNIPLTWVLHDLPHDLTIMNKGQCRPQDASGAYHEDQDSSAEDITN